MKKKMKLFVWEDVLCDYTAGQMIALATNIQEARDTLLKACPYIPLKDLMTEPTEYSLTAPVAFTCWGGG